MISNNKYILLCICSFAILIVTVLFSGYDVHAMKVGHYSYKKVHDALPDKFQTSDYVYTSDDIAYIKFATMGDNPYRTSVKYTSGKTDFLYCVNYSKHIVFDKTYSTNNKMFNDTLKSKIAVALFYGTTSWGKKADTSYTTGNYILDYYMTQAVIHGLIYKYGDEKSSYGFDFSRLTFDSKADTLEKKTKALYKFCCDYKVTLKDGEFQTTSFSFDKPKDTYLYQNGDCFESNTVSCTTSNSNATVTSFQRKITNSNNDTEHIQILADQNTYNSSFRISLEGDPFASITPGNYSIGVEETVDFKPYIANFWYCSDSQYKDNNQEVVGLTSHEISKKSSVSFDITVGQVVIHKKDKITGENIENASFELLQYNDSSKKFELYKKLEYNSSKKQYESGTIFINRTNTTHQFKVVEVQAGANYYNDWSGEIFTISKEKYNYSYTVTNSPELGKISIKKTGEDFKFKDSFVTSKKIELPSITFSLYAAKDISINNQILYKKDQKIKDGTTDAKGELLFDELYEGSYYIKEVSNNSYHILMDKPYTFEIQRDRNRKYSVLNYSLENHLKKCQINVYKYYYTNKDIEQKEKIPLANAKFGLYALHDIVNVSGECIVKKDTLISEGFTNNKGQLLFDNLVYADYYVKELAAPVGFLLNDGILEILKQNFKPEDDIYHANIESLNQKQKFKLQLTKYGEDFNNFSKVESELGEYYTYQLNQKVLSGVTFSLYDDQEQLVATSVSNESGILEFENLEPGKYIYKEEKAPYNYIRNQDSQELIIEPDNRNLDVTIVNNSKEGFSYQSIIKKETYNNLFHTTVFIHKTGEHVLKYDSGIEYDQIPLEGIVFGIYQKFDYKASDGTVLPADSCVGYATTDESGNASLQLKIPEGEYYVKELKTKKGYVIDSENYSFIVKADNNQNIEIHFDEDNSFMNSLAKASVRIIKTDINTDKLLKGVTFTLYNDKNEMIDSFKTNKKGEILVENLPYGSYYFIETKCKSGYYSTNNKFHFTIKSDECITLNITNQPILKLGYEENFKIALCISSCVIFMILLSVIVVLKKNVNTKYED